MGTRVEGAGKGRCEGEEGVGWVARTDVNVHAALRGTKPTEVG